MAKAVEYILLEGRLYQLASKDVIEVVSPLRANTEQPLVGPPDKFEERPAVARPVILAEVKMLIQIAFAKLDERFRNVDDRQAIQDCYNVVFQGLGKLDQGPIAQRLSEKEIQERRWTTFKSPYGQ